jgi:hypothetical protein
MLKDPPCIRLLVGCSGTDTGGGGDASGDTGSVGLTLGGASRSSSTSGISSSARDSVSSVASSARSTLGDLSARLPSFASGTLIGKSAKLYTAHYIITAKNIGSQALQGVKIAHGPLPFGAEFDASRSEKSCILNSKIVECTIDLASGAQKDLSLVYKAGGSMSCAFARLLEKAKTTVNSVTGNASQVVTTVTCRMESADGASSLSSRDVSTGDGFNQSFSSLGATGNSTGLLTQGSGALSGTAGSKVSDYKQGYKQYSAVLPRTGVLQDYFASVGTPQSMIIQRHSTESSFSVIPLITLSLLSIVIVYGLLKGSFRYFDYEKRRK